MYIRKTILLFLILSFHISSLEIDQFTDREKYQENATDFTEELNLYTNGLIKKGVGNFNKRFHGIKLSQKEIHRYVAFEIYKTTAGDGNEEYGFIIPSRIDLFYAIHKRGRGPIQEWIEGEANRINGISLSNNIYSDIYPDAYQNNLIIKVGGEFVGPDKIDHFFDQGYSYWVQSDFGKSDNKAKSFGIDSENGWYGFKSGGVFSFGDLRANWAGYQFYKYLFSGEKSHLLVSDDGFVSIRRSFDWNEHVDWQFDELKNPSLYTKAVKKKIYNYFQENIDSYCETYEYLVSKDIFSWINKRDTFYLTDGFQCGDQNFFNIEEFYSSSQS